MIKAVLIDIDNTLLDFNLSATTALEMAFKNHELPFDAQTFPKFKAINDELWARIERGEWTREDLHRERFNIIFSRWGIDFDGHIIEQEFLNNLFDCAIPVDGALDLVKYLASKYILCTASNAPYLQQINRLTISGILPYIKEVFASEKIGVSKPDKRFFDVCLNYLNSIAISECVVIGDSLSADIEGGKNYGMKTIFFNHDKKAYSKDELKFVDYKVDNLLDIKNIL